jgi:hypothetical protein
MRVSVVLVMAATLSGAKHLVPSIASAVVPTAAGASVAEVWIEQADEFVAGG